MQNQEQRLLIVDDDEMFCHVLSRALTRRGFEVMVAHDADQALNIAAQFTPTMATLDLKLEHSSGLKLLPELLSAVPSCRIVVLTGYSSIATAVEAIKLGAQEHDGNISATARALGMHRRTLQRKLQKRPVRR